MHDFSVTDDYSLLEYAMRNPSPFGIWSMPSCRLPRQGLDEPFPSSLWVVHQELQLLEVDSMLGFRASWAILGLVHTNPNCSVCEVLISLEVGKDGLLCLARLRLFGFISNQRSKLKLTQRGLDLLRQHRFIT